MPLEPQLRMQSRSQTWRARHRLSVSASAQGRTIPSHPPSNFRCRTPNCRWTDSIQELRGPARTPPNFGVHIGPGPM